MKNLNGLSKIFTVVALVASGFQSKAQVTALTGVISDCSNNHQIIGAKLSADSGVCFSVQGGVYYIRVAHGGTYTITIQKQGYADTLIPGVQIQEGSLTTRNFCLNVKAGVPSQPFVAALNNSQSRVDLNWESPEANFEQLDDDGIQDTSILSNDQGRMYAVKFTVSASPISIVGGSVDIGESYSYSSGTSPSLLSPLTMQVYDASGTGGSPGNPVGHSVTMTPSAFGWNFFTIEGVSLGSGDFYLVMKQSGSPPNACHMAVDMSTSHLKSWQKENSGSWVLANGNFMLRAVINGPGGPPEHPLSLTGYRLYRFLVQDRLNASSWVQLGTTSINLGADNSWTSLPDSCFMWAVKAEYSGNITSRSILSNWLGKNRYVNLSVLAYYSCNPLHVEGARVVMTSLPPYEGLFSYTGYTGADYKVNFTGVQKAKYSIQATHPGYNSNTTILYLDVDHSFVAGLSKYIIPPGNPVLDEKSLQLSWTPPMQTLTLLDEDFSSGFTLNGWTTPNAYWTIGSQSGNPTPDAEFTWLTAAVNYSASLISPVIYGDGNPYFKLKYDLSLQDYANSGTEQLDVEIQVYGTGSWTNLRHYSNTGNISWQTDSIDLGGYSAKNFFIRFHAHGIDAYRITSWHIDNVKLISSGRVPSSCVTGYYLYLNGAGTGATADTACTVPGSFLPYGSVDTVCITARYGYDESEKVCTQGFVSKWLCSPSHLQGTKFGYTILLSWNKPECNEEKKGAAPGSVPVRSGAGITLLGYNIERNGIPLAYIANPDTLYYYDRDLNPGTYSYSVTACYDVSQLPPLRENSAPSDSVSLDINGSYSWPFNEPWDKGTFDFNSWKHTGSWTVTSSEGNPAPSVEFQGQPSRTGYSDTLETLTINPGEYTCAKVYLDFDLRLRGSWNTGEEFLTIEYNPGITWNLVEEFTNASDIPWTHKHLELKNASGRSFNIRFHAHGANSGDLLSWDLDNISVYAICLPPDTLTYEYNPAQVSLSWNPPRCGTRGPSSQWIHWDNGANYNGIGWGCEVKCNLAARWTPIQLAAFDGGAVTKIKFFAYAPAGVFRARIWQGAAGTDMIFDQAVPFIQYGQWNTVDLEEPLFIDVSQDLWIGLYVDFLGFPMGLDSGPTFDGYGNMMTYHGSWVSIESAFFCPGNWNIEAYVETTRESFKPVTVHSNVNPGGCDKASFILHKSHMNGDVGKFPSSTAEEFGAVISGYNVWRTDSTGSPSTFHRINGSPVKELSFTDFLTHNPGVYKYYVTTVMNSGVTNGFLCESIAGDTVTVSRTGIQEAGTAGISIYPNPADEQVIIKSNFVIQSVIVLDHLGQTIYTDSRVNSTSFRFSVSPFQDGMYFIKATTDKGTFVEKITVAH